VLTAPATTFGFGAQSGAGNAVADDFTVPVGEIWNVASIDFYAYQTGATTFGFTSATWSIVSGGVNSTSVVASGTTSLINAGRAGYRVTSTTLTDTTRAIYSAQADIIDTLIPTGTYWLRWSLTGSTAFSGPWQPPTSDAAVGNAAQSITSGTFASVVDAGSALGVTLPFGFNGVISLVAVPEPGTIGMMLAGGLAVVGAARRRTAR
jgi:PEP-CTERM motif